MTFQFKQKSRDFYVSENLPYKLSGKGDAFYEYISKRNITTYDIIDHLRKDLGITRMSLGIAWLKDKKAVAKQWISIYDRALSKAWWEKVFLNSLSKIVKVVETGRHDRPMNMSTPITNSFHIKFRSTKNLWQEERQKAQKIVQQLLDDGYPNLYGKQRFGINGRNSTQWYEIMTGTSKENFKKWEAIFKLQAYSSKVYNEYVEHRAQQWLALMDGDILTWTKKWKTFFGLYHEQDQMVDIVEVKSEKSEFLFVPHATGKTLAFDERMMSVTWPVPGYNTPLPDPETISGAREKKFWEKLWLDATSMKKYKEYPVYGLRRAMRVHPTQTRVAYKDDDLIVDFTLPSGSYASIVFDALDEALR